MKLNNSFKGLVVIVLLSISSPVMANTDPGTPAKNVEARAMELENRLNEIKALDKKEMTRAERKALRKEVKEIKKELAVGGGVYLSVGAIVLIALLLILLL